jgi:hypothetical protein
MVLSLSSSKFLRKQVTSYEKLEVPIGIIFPHMKFQIPSGKQTEWSLFTLG